MTDIRNPLIAADEETGNTIKKSAVAELCGTNAELMRNKVLAENSTSFSMNSLVVFLPNCWDITRNVADPHHDAVAGTLHSSVDSAPWHAVGVHLGVLLRVPPPSPISQTGWAARAELMRNQIGIKFSERDVGRPSTDFVHFEAVGAALKSTFLRSDGAPHGECI